MKRRNLLKNMAVGTAGTLALSQRAQTQTLASDNASDTAIEWRMATSWPQRESISFQAVETFCDRIKAMTEGRFVITPYEAGEIAPALEVFDVVQAAEVECGHTVGAYYLGKQPTFVFVTALPFGLTPYQQYAWFYYGGGLEIMQQLHQDFGIVIFPAGNSGVQMGGWFNREVNTVADLKGLKIRIAGFGAQVLERLGAKPILLGGGEVYDALASGQVDAAEWQNPHEDEKLRLQEVAKYYYYPGWWEPGSIREVIINRQQWEQLPKAYQLIVQAAAAEANLTTLASFDAANGKALQRLLAAGVELRAYSPEILKAANSTTFELLEETAKQDASFKKLYEQWQQFRRKIFQWNLVNELSFDSFSLQS